MSRREKIRLDLSPLYLPFYDKLCAILPDEWQPYSGTRSFQAQDALYAQGRTAPGGIVTNAKGGESAHNYGCATDWTVWTPGETPVWMKKEDPAWQVYIDAVTSAGLRPGAEFGDVDHCELKIDVAWPAIIPAYDHGGLASASEMIKTAMVDQPADPTEA